MDYFELLKDATFVGKAVLVALAFFSFACWYLIGAKWKLLTQTRKEGVSFLAAFRNSARLSEVRAICEKYPHAPQSGLFLAGFSELNFQLKHQNTSKSGEGPKVRSLDSINRVLQRASFVEIAKLEKSLNFLATTAAVAPFVGLFGTVVGIIEAFADIAQEKSASLAVVAPGIAEALIATAFGLFAAIPAVMAYNYFVNRVRGISAEMEDFCLEFLGIVEKNFT